VTNRHNNTLPQKKIFGNKVIQGIAQMYVFVQGRMKHFRIEGKEVHQGNEGPSLFSFKI
jgi:hypothetical protein